MSPSEAILYQKKKLYNNDVCEGSFVVIDYCYLYIAPYTRRMQLHSYPFNWFKVYIYCGARTTYNYFPRLCELWRYIRVYLIDG